MKKRVLALLLAATMVFGLAACGGNDSGNTSGSTDDAAATEDAAADVVAHLSKDIAVLLGFKTSFAKRQQAETLLLCVCPCFLPYF